jgi:hypothetical protein
VRTPQTDLVERSPCRAECREMSGALHHDGTRLLG